MTPTDDSDSAFRVVSPDDHLSSRAGPTAPTRSNPIVISSRDRPGRRGAWRTIGLAMLVLGMLTLAGQNWAPIGWGLAQDKRSKSLEDEFEEASSPKPVANATSSSPAATDAKMPSLLDLFWASGAIGIIICLSSMVALGFIVEHAITIRHSKLIPPDVVKELDRLISSGQVDAALEFVRQPQHDSLVSEVVRSGLERYRNSEFGFAEYRAAVEEAGEDYTSKLYRKTEALNVIGAVAPMLGLLGTVQGMILAFNTIAARGGLARPDELAGSISLALVTTFEGLVVAIPTMVAFSFFRNRIDSLVAEAGKRVEQLMLPLGRQRGRAVGP